MTTDQERALETLSHTLNGTRLRVQYSKKHTGDPEDTALVVGWGDDGEGLLLFDDGTTDRVSADAPQHVLDALSPGSATGQ